MAKIWIALAFALAVMTVHGDQHRMLDSGTKFTAEAKTYGDGPDEYEEWQRDGIRYRIYYRDASAIFATEPGDSFQDSRERWGCVCEKDAIDDFVLCMAKIYDLVVVLHQGGAWSVRIIGEEQTDPGTEVAIRLGNGKPFKANEKVQFTPEVSAKIVAQLSDGQTVTTRYSAWPDSRYVDKSWQLQGFSIVAEYLAWAVAQID